MSKLKDIPFGSEIPTFDNDGYITLSSGLKGPSGNTIITMASGSAFFDGEACCASCAYCACEACCACYACEACYAGLAGDALYASCASEACYACAACLADFVFNPLGSDRLGASYYCDGGYYVLVPTSCY